MFLDINKSDYQGNTALHLVIESLYLSENEKIETIKVLINHPKINLNIKNARKETPLELAKSEDSHEITQLLVEKNEGRNN